MQYVVLAHHHMDHAGGLRTYVDTGATVVVGPGNGPHFHKTWMGGSRAKSGAKAAKAKQAKIVEVATQHALSDGKRTVSIYHVDNPHSAGMLMGYVEDARLGFVTDLWSPGRDKFGDKLTPGQMAVFNAVKKYGLQPEKFAGGHGSNGSYAELAAVATKSNENSSMATGWSGPVEISTRRHYATIKRQVTCGDQPPVKRLHKGRNGRAQPGERRRVWRGWSPGGIACVRRPAQDVCPAKPFGAPCTPEQAAVAVTKENLQAENFTGGHGATGIYAELAAARESTCNRLYRNWQPPGECQPLAFSCRQALLALSGREWQILVLFRGK